MNFLPYNYFKKIYYKRKRNKELSFCSFCSVMENKLKRLDSLNNSYENKKISKDEYYLEYQKITEDI